MSVEIMPNWFPFDQDTAPKTRASGPKMIGRTSRLTSAQTRPAMPSCLPSSVLVTGGETAAWDRPQAPQKLAAGGSCDPQPRQNPTLAAVAGGAIGGCGGAGGGGGDADSAVSGAGFVAGSGADTSGSGAGLSGDGTVGAAAASGGYHLPSEACHQPASGEDVSVTEMSLSVMREQGCCGAVSHPARTQRFRSPLSQIDRIPRSRRPFRRGNRHQSRSCHASAGRSLGIGLCR